MLHPSRLTVGPHHVADLNSDQIIWWLHSSSVLHMFIEHGQPEEFFSCLLRTCVAQHNCQPNSRLVHLHGGSQFSCYTDCMWQREISYEVWTIYVYTSYARRMLLKTSSACESLLTSGWYCYNMNRNIKLLVLGTIRPVNHNPLNHWQSKEMLCFTNLILSKVETEHVHKGITLFYNWSIIDPAHQQMNNFLSHQFHIC